MTATIKTIPMVAVHIPALKMLPIASQPDINIAAITRTGSKTNDLFFIKFYLRIFKRYFNTITYYNQDGFRLILLPACQYVQAVQITYGYFF